MSTESNSLEPAKAVPAKTRLRREAPPPRKGVPIWLILIVAAVLGVGLVVTLHYIFQPVERPPALGKEVLYPEYFFSMRGPRSWAIDDRVHDNMVFMQGPRIPGYRPLMIVTWYPAPGKLAKFMEEHKARTKFEEPSVVYLKDDTDSVDGCESRRLEYTSDYVEKEGAKPFKLHTLQFVIKDPTYPVYYKITCACNESDFDEFKAVMDASARTFHRLPVPETKTPRFLKN